MQARNFNVTQWLGREVVKIDGSDTDTSLTVLPVGLMSDFHFIYCDLL